MSKKNIIENNIEVKKEDSVEKKIFTDFSKELNTKIAKIKSKKISYAYLDKYYVEVFKTVISKSTDMI